MPRGGAQFHVRFRALGYNEPLRAEPFTTNVLAHRQIRGLAVSYPTFKASSGDNRPCMQVKSHFVLIAVPERFISPVIAQIAYSDVGRYPFHSKRH